MQCSRCQSGLKIGRKNEALFPYGSYSFCSEGCLLSHIRSQKSVSREFLQDLGISTAPQNWGDRNCHSTFLGVTFRSWFECQVAEHIVREWKTQVFYEAHSLPLDERHCYVPDFWLPAYGVWLEVKGEWRMGARSKFENALCLMGNERLILIPETYRTWFKGRAKR